MFDIFKQDIKIGDKVKLYLTTGKEPEGIVVSIGENFVLLVSTDGTQNRFFDKLIGGWDLIKSKQPDLDNKSTQVAGINSNADIDQNQIIELYFQLKKSLHKSVLAKFIGPNANIIEVRGTTCIASNEKNPKLLILNNRLYDKDLIKSIENFQVGELIPVVLSIYDNKKGKTIVSTAVLPNTIEKFLEDFYFKITEADYNTANLTLSVLRNYVYKSPYFWNIVKEFRKLNNHSKQLYPKIITVNKSEDTDQKNKFKSVEKEINDLIRQSKFEFALKQIAIELGKDNIEDKYKSSLLLKKAQIFSSLNNPEASEKAYEELVAFNEKINASSNNLSHLYTELARLQSLNQNKKAQAILSVAKALDYNRNNNFAQNLLKQLEGDSKKAKKAIRNEMIESDDHLFIDAPTDKSIISNMIDLDIKEHKYSHPEIIKNGGKPTAFIAELIIKEARESGGRKATENYPLYLDAAKAFSELNVGSYGLNDYLESIAYYSMLKGNSLYAQFKYDILNKEIDFPLLTRLNESACDYYIESLNILSNVDSKSLELVLTNFLQLKVAKYSIENRIDYDYMQLFKSDFPMLFNSCIKNEKEEIQWIGIKSIIDIGSNSLALWNKLTTIFPRTKVDFVSIFRLKHTKELICKYIKHNIDITTHARIFLETSFKLNSNYIADFKSKIDNILKIEFVPTNFRIINEEWNSLNSYKSILNNTDIETFQVTENIIQIIQPYLNRSDKERGNILYTVIKKIESQLEFINQNTTYYGRTFFYRLLKKWRSDVDDLFEEKIAQSYPLLTVEIDPPYFIDFENEVSAPIIIRNEGDATAEGYFLRIYCESTEYEGEVEIPFETTEELNSKGKMEFNFIIPQDILEDSNAVEVKIEIEAVYQKNRLPAKRYEFTIEREPTSFLSLDDLPWKTGNSTPESLFFGRDKLITDLFNHYRSINKDKPYVLFGLTRTGKSSILEYLRKKIDGTAITYNGRSLKYIAFEWELQEISNNINARDFYVDILYERLYLNLRNVLLNDGNWDNTFEIDDKGKFTDFKKILEYLKSKDYYPIIFVDEFSYIMDLMNKGTIGKPFLAALREYSLNGLVSFVFAGTYDIRKLVTDEKYGITGQLVHVIEYQVDKIESDDAESLITIIDEKLSFTPEAINHIKYLSGNIPYFIQIICKNCGEYAVEHKRRYIGYPELEKVIQILTGETYIENTKITRLPTGIFQNNQYSTDDPTETKVLISTLCYLNKKGLRGIGSHEIEKFWSEKGLSGFKSKLANSFQSLLDKKILIDSLDEGLPVYKFSVDLFRRWWHVSHQDINLEISTLKDE